MRMEFPTGRRYRVGTVGEWMAHLNSEVSHYLDDPRKLRDVVVVSSPTLGLRGIDWIRTKAPFQTRYSLFEDEETGKKGAFG